MEHFGFILASYLTTILIISVLGLWLALDYKAQRKALLALEARGVRRRSVTLTESAGPIETGVSTDADCKTEGAKQ